MIKKIELENFMQLKNQKLEFSNINILAGVNDSGKTSLLKLIYASIKAREEDKNKSSIDKFDEHFSLKLRNVFDIEKIGSLVTKKEGILKVKLLFQDNSGHSFSFSSKAEKKFQDSFNSDNHDFNIQTTFLPPKEVLTIQKIIRTMVEKYDLKGYDDTYYDLVKSLDVPISRGALSRGFKEADKELENSLDGRIIQKDGVFSFQKGKQTFSISLTAEGVKKIGIINQLLKNKTINENTILIIDEPEVALHPSIIEKVAKILFDLSQVGVQVFIATHSYFILKSFQLLAYEHDKDILFFNLDKTNEEVIIDKSNLKEGMPKNEIVDSSIELFDRENAIKIKKLGI
ncbi:MAG: Unknown protein [uncultured Sulfurovum sp.]|uniref:ATPase AAA-type core domain-containing protein n=1 Tax=uncultured Sulfurovum sp. TaxID=269237 RepID=A0A6S6TL41_9BACT|nr:MAG: Unknown protein [uncultured Sulfurovum sp.]